MRTIIITFTHEGMKAAKKAREATDGEVIIYCHQRCADAYKNEVVSFAAVGSVIKSEFAVSDRILFVCCCNSCKSYRTISYKLGYRSGGACCR